MKTITVKSALGNDKQIELFDYVNQWVHHTLQLRNLADSSEDLQLIREMADTIGQLAERKFNALYEAQNQN